EPGRHRGWAVPTAPRLVSALLAGDTVRGRPNGQGERSPEFLGHGDGLRALCAEWGVVPAAAALHFSLREPRIHTTVVGVNSVDRLHELEVHERAVIDVEFWEALEALGTPPEAPTD